MYLTTKKYVERAVINGDIIDALFEGVTVQPTRVQTTIEYDDFYRTITREVNEVTTNYCPRDKYINCCYAVHVAAAAHPHPEEEYETFRIPKKTRGFREINAPRSELKRDQKDVASSLASLGVLSHDSAWAYIPGRSVVKAMKEHQRNNSRWFLKIDLHDFFGSCSPEFIKESLLNIFPFAYYKDIEPEITEDLMNNLTHIACLNGGLPQGTPLSPALVNLIMVGYDYKINKMLYELGKNNIVLRQHYVYTRYADDIIISARSKFDYNLIVNKIKELLESTPLTINEEKTRFGSSAGRNWNLGIMLNKDNKLSVGHKKKHDIKVLVHNYCIDTINGIMWELDELYYIQGQLSWLQNVEPDYYKGILNYWRVKYHIDVAIRVAQDIKIKIEG